MVEREEILRLEGITKLFFNICALKNVTFTLKKGEILSLIGENGAGKSTMMNIIGGVIQPEEGSMTLHGKLYTPQRTIDAKNAGIAFIHQELNLFNNLSIIDNIYINSFARYPGTPFIKKSAMRENIRKLLDSIDLHVSPDMMVEKLSPGERQLVEIAKALSGNPDIIIFDEPTTSLTTRETRKLFALIKKLREQGKSIIYISHILADVYELSDQIVVLRDGVVVDTGKKEDFSMNRMIVSMVGRDIKQMYPAERPVAQAKKLLEIENLSQPGIIKNISMHVDAGEIVGIFGLMGSGRSELANIIFGLDPYSEGMIRYMDVKLNKQDPIDRIKRGFAFVTENRREEGLLMEFPVYDNITLAVLRDYKKAFGLVDNAKLQKPVAETVSELRIKCSAIKKNQVKGLSGGNQQKVVLCKWLLAKPSFLMVDEPTRGIDVGSKSEIYNILNNFAKAGMGTLVISSELEELIGICNRILVLSKGEIVGSFNSNNFDREVILGAAFRQNISNGSTNIV